MAGQSKKKNTGSGTSPQPPAAARYSHVACREPPQGAERTDHAETQRGQAEQGAGHGTPSGSEQKGAGDGALLAPNRGCGEPRGRARCPLWGGGVGTLLAPGGARSSPAARAAAQKAAGPGDGEPPEHAEPPTQPRSTGPAPAWGHNEGKEDEGGPTAAAPPPRPRAPGHERRRPHRQWGTFGEGGPLCLQPDLHHVQRRHCNDSPPVSLLSGCPPPWDPPP